jgi:arylsulfatase A-like enzyme
MSQPNRRPNVLFIALDDLNEWVGCMGRSPDVKTPNMDRLAARGRAFPNAVCASPVCNPSRTAILSGMSPTTTGCYLLNDELEHSPARGRTVPLPLYFRQNGYRTLTVGKIDHGGYVERATQAERGQSMWDEQGGWFDGQQFGMHSRRAATGIAGAGLYSFADHWGPLDDDQAATLSDTHVARWASEQLSREQDGPFFLATGFFRPHLPLIAPQRFFDLYDPDDLTLPETGPEDFGDLPAIARQVALTGYQDRAGGSHRTVTAAGLWRGIVHAYLACVSYVDDCIGQVLRALDDGPHAENTVVVLWSDNGWSLGEHFHWYKWSLWDCGASVPLIARAPGMAECGRACDAGVSLLDLYPTLTDLCGLDTPDELDGVSIAPLITGEQTTRQRPALTSLGRYNHSLRTDRWRYIRYCDGSEELYDHAADRWEHANLADRPEHAETLESLRAHLPDDCAPALTSSPPAGQPIDLEPGQSVWFRGVQTGIAGEAITIRARLRAEGDEGVILHHAGQFAGYALYVRNRQLRLAVMDVPQPLRWDRLEPARTIVEAFDPLPDRAVGVEGKLEVDGTITLSVDGEVVATGRAPGPLSIHPTGLLEAGQYTRTKYQPAGDYRYSDAFPGELERVRVEFG